MGQSVTGAQTSEGQSLLPQAMAQVLPLATSARSRRVSLCFLPNPTL